MKNFIKAHPYLSCTGLAVVSNIVGASASIPDHETFTKYLLSFTLNSTLPSIGSTAFDQYAHQNLFDNKPLQYGLTAVESVLLIFPIMGAVHLLYEAECGNKTFLEGIKCTFSDLTKLDLSKPSIRAKCLTAASVVQSLGFKYIFDLANEQPEVEIDITNIVEETLQYDYVEEL